MQSDLFNSLYANYWVALGFSQWISFKSHQLKCNWKIHRSSQLCIELLKEMQYFLSWEAGSVLTRSISRVFFIYFLLFPRSIEMFSYMYCVLIVHSLLLSQSCQLEMFCAYYVIFILEWTCLVFYYLHLSLFNIFFTFCSVTFSTNSTHIALLWALKWYFISIK